MAEEAIIQQEILDYLQATGWFAWTNITKGHKRGGVRSRNNKKGSPDIEGIKGGVYLACEVKGPNATLQTDQREWLRKVVSHGGFAIVVGSLRDAILALSEKTKKGAANEAIWIGKNIKFRA